MTAIDDTLQRVVSAQSWNQRIAQIRLVPQRHGTAEHPAIYAGIARSLYLEQLAPDFAYVHEATFYELGHFREAYDIAVVQTQGFTAVDEETLTQLFTVSPTTLLVFRTMLGLTKEEFAHSTLLVGAPHELTALTAGKIDSMERRGTVSRTEQARVAALTVVAVMDGTLFGDPPTGLKSKQQKPDTHQGWETVRDYAHHGVPYDVFLHQRHYGGAFRQLLDATSTRRGDLIEHAVEALFREHRIPHIRTGAHNQEDIARRFEVRVTPAPDFVVFDDSGALRAILECKGTNNGGTARDKALRFERLRDEAVRLGGIPLVAVLGGIGWARVNDALGPVVRDTEGRVFTLVTLTSMLEVAPFPSLVGAAPLS